MNIETANRLNALRAAAASPVCLVGAGSGYLLEGGTPEERETAYAHINTLRESVLDLAVKAEIMEAASQDRNADTYTGDERSSLIYWGLVNGHQKGAGGKAFALIRASIEEYLRVGAEQKTKDYQTYRLACEQGVAVAPPAAG